jgi:hypothetical protein
MTLKCNGRRLIPRLEKLEARYRADQPYELLCLFGDNGDLGTVRMLIDGKHSEVLEVTDALPCEDDEEDDDDWS